MEPVKFCAGDAGAKPSASINPVSTRKDTPTQALFTRVSVVLTSKIQVLTISIFALPQLVAFNANTILLSREKYRYSKLFRRRRTLFCGIFTSLVITGYQ